MNKIKLILMALIILMSTKTASADITIKVLKGGEAPHLYAYTSNGGTDVPCTGFSWPGIQFEEKDADGYWTMTISGVNTVNIIFNDGDTNQTGDIIDVVGINGVATFIYDGFNKAVATIPKPQNNSYQSGKVAYFACPPTWNTSNLKSQIKHNDYYEEHDMEYIGTDGAGHMVFADLSFTNWGDTPQQIHFYDMAGKDTEMFDYTLGGYYNTGGLATLLTNLSSANGFNDDNFRAGIATQLGINDEDAFMPSSVTKLDVSGCGITSLAGINQFTALIELDASNNNISRADLNSNSNLEILDLSFNSSSLIGPSTNSGEGHITFANNAPLTYLDLSNNSGLTWFSAIYNTYHIKTLKTLKLANTPLGWAQAIEHQSDLTYLDLSNSNISNTDVVNLSSLTKLEYLDLSNNNVKKANLTFPSTLPSLKTLKLNGCTNLSHNSSNGGSISLSPFTALEHLEFADVDLMTSTIVGTIPQSAKGKIKYIDFSNDKMVNPILSGFAALETLLVKNNTTLETLSVDNCTALEEVDVTGNTKMMRLILNNDNLSNDAMPNLTGLPSCTSLTALDLNNNLFTRVPNFELPTSCTSLYLNSNQLTSISVPSGSPVQFLYAEDNGFSGALSLTAESTATLKGLDLGNNGITSFKAEGTSLSALMIGNNPNMTTLELHGNTSLTCTTSGNTMSDGSGLYLLGNTALKTIDLSNSSFNQIGADNAMLGLSAVETLNGSHNHFTTFTNSNYDIIDGNGNTRLKNYVSGKSSLEDLTGLKHLDLSYNEIADSVHLYRNTLLEYLDVSHNNNIGPLATTDAEKLAMRLRKADLLRKYHNKSTPVGISCSPATQATLTENETLCLQPGRPFDYRDKDLRDTTGLFHLDLNYNVELKYLDISETNIHNTAAGWTYMCPGWEVGTGGWYSTTTTSTTPARSPANGSTRHHFVWLKTCGKLEEFHADNNSMQSLGVSTSPYLHTITAKGMHGDCYFMRDYQTIGHGNITVSGSIALYDHTDYSYNTDGELEGTIHYRDADGVIDGTNYFPNPVKWYDVSNSDYYIVRTANGKDLEHLDVSGNHLSQLKVSGNTKLQYVDTENNDLLTYVDANDLPDLAILKVADNPVLEKLYADNDPSLPSISGLDDCTALKYLHVQNNGLFGSNGFNVEANTNLQSLLAYNCNLPGELKVGQCAAMDTLCVNDNLITTLDISSLANMHWLDCYNNTGITTLVPGTSIGMTHLDLHNCSVLDLDLATNTAMQYMDCDNNHVRELNFTDATNIETIHANSNNLFQIKMGTSHALLADLQFEHNHINGINLSGCKNGALTAANIKDSDNGRTIVANCSLVQGEKVYYFQLLDITYGGYFLNDMYCNEDNETYGRTTSQGTTSGKKSLTDDGFVQVQATFGNVVEGHRPQPGRALDPDLVLGTIVVLNNTSTDPAMGSGTETYTYKNGLTDTSTSEFYLNWSAQSDVITEVEDLSSTKLEINGSTSSISINTSQAMPIIVTDINGRIIDKRNIDVGTTIIDGLEPGIYIVNHNKVIVR